MSRFTHRDFEQDARRQPQIRPEDRLRWEPIFEPEESPQPAREPFARRVPGLVALFLLVLAVFLVLRHAPELYAFLTTMGRIGPGSTADEKTEGLCAFAVVAVSILAAMKIAIQSTPRNER